jgi:hypothetical protein
MLLKREYTYMYLYILIKYIYIYIYITRLLQIISKIPPNQRKKGNVNSLDRASGYFIRISQEITSLRPDSIISREDRVRFFIRAWRPNGRNPRWRRESTFELVADTDRSWR